MDLEKSSAAMPYYELGELKKKMKSLKSKEGVEADSLVGSMDKLSSTLSAMLEILQKAGEEMEEEGEHEIKRALKPLEDKIDELTRQNKIIAEGMVALADLVKEKLKDVSTKPREISHLSIGQNPFPSGPRGNDKPIFPNISPPPPVPSMDIDTQNKAPPPFPSPFPNVPARPAMRKKPGMGMPPPPMPFGSNK